MKTEPNALYADDPEIERILRLCSELIRLDEGPWPRGRFSLKPDQEDPPTIDDIEDLPNA